MQLTIARKLALSFGLMILLMLSMVVVVFFSVSSVQTKQRSVVAVRMPTVQAAQRLISAVNESLADLRGFIVLGDAQFKTGRAAAWEAVSASLNTLQTLSEHWTDQANRDRLAEVAELFTQIESVQQKVEDVVWTDDNTPALKLMLTDAAPQADKMISALNDMISIEQFQEGTEDRKALLSTMAEARGELALATSSMRAFLTMGDDADEASFQEKWDAHTNAMDSLDSDSWMFTDEQTEALTRYQDALSLFEELPDRMFKIQNSDEANVGNFLLATQAAPLEGQAMSVLNKLMSSQLEKSEIEQSSLKAQTSQMTIIMCIVALVGILVGSLVAIVISRQISGPIRTLTGQMQKIAKGDLTGEPLDVRRDDELGQMALASNQMVESLRTLVAEVQDASMGVVATADQIAASSEDIEEGVKRQQQQTSQVSSAVEEMAASVTQVAQNAAEASENAIDAGKQAAVGGEVVSQTVSGIRGISEQVNESAVAVGALGKRSEEIGAIIGVINDIADQTNLLALNAAIEAARAGEHGKGFAVVADEVRNLAERTTNATEEVAQSITAIQKETTLAVDRMQSGQEGVDDGVQLAEQAGEALGAIVNGSKTLADKIQSIAAASEEQSAASAQVARNVEEISSVADSTAGSVLQASRAAEDLSSKSAQLQTLIGQFKLA